jgi:hypothetical protein
MQLKHFLGEPNFEKLIFDSARHHREPLRRPGAKRSANIPHTVAGRFN